MKQEDYAPLPNLPRQTKACRHDCPGWQVHWKRDPIPNESFWKAQEITRETGFMTLFSPTAASAKAEFTDIQFRHWTDRNLEITDVRPC